MITTLLVAFVAWCAEAAPQHLEADQFDNLAVSFGNPIKDISFVCEGAVQFVGPKSLLKGKPDSMSRIYQGRYTYRSDNSSRYEMYSDYMGVGGASSKKDLVIFKGKYHELSTAKDLKRRGAPLVRVAVPGDLNAPGVPERLYYIPFFNTLHDAKAYNYKFERWETYQARSCLVVRLDEMANAEYEPRAWRTLWIDLERGGNILKAEGFRGTKLLYRLDKVELQKFPTPTREEVWVPLKGEFESFLWEDQYSSNPMFRETYSIVTSSISFNRGVPDSVFALNASFGNMANTEEINKIKREFDAAPAFRSDPQSVKARLDKAIESADSQSGRLLASTPDDSHGVVWATVGLVAVGILVLGVAVGLKWKS